MRRYEEREDKFDVDMDWVMPPLASLVPDGGRLDRDDLRLDSTYFDTSEAGLRLFGVTLRRRVGGSDTGWQLKVPSGTSRIELQSGSRAKSLPRALSEAVRGLLAGEAVTSVATVKTRRTAYRIVDADSNLLLEVADDEVESGPAEAELPSRSWRQIEIEYGSASTKLIKRARKLMHQAGATPSESRNKLDQALGRIPWEPEQGGYGAGEGTTGQLVGDYIATQCDVLASNDVGLRIGVNLVHKTRVAARRLRSTLRVFADLFDADAAEELDRELSWYADLLGEVRDRDVLGAHLTERVEELPRTTVRTRVAEEIAGTLEAQRSEAFQRLLKAMSTRRYRGLIQLLRSWRVAPPFTADAGSKPSAVEDFVAQAGRKADKRLRKAGDDVDKLHRARKSLKRLRYAAELGEPADSDLAGVANQAKRLQTVLGDHQDAIVAAGFLSSTAASDGENAFSYGFLMATELARAAQIRAELSHHL